MTNYTLEYVVWGALISATWLGAVALHAWKSAGMMP